MRRVSNPACTYGRAPAVPETNGAGSSPAGRPGSARCRAFGAACAVLMWTGAAAAAPAPEPAADWPCPQHRVESLTSAQIWDGPRVEDLSGWENDPALSRLVSILASRRVPVTEAAADIRSYAASLPQGERRQKLTLLFAGVFARLNAERTAVVNGIGIYQRRQRARAAELERESTEIARLEKEGAGDAKAADEVLKARERYAWNARVFDERQKTIAVACEIPVLIEQRIYELAREIRSHMPE